MNYYTHVESNRFKVQNAESFHKEFWDRISGDYIELRPFEDGFQFWITNPAIKDEEDLDVEEIIREHLRDGEVLTTIRICRSEVSSELAFDCCVATNMGIEWGCSSTILKNMVQNLYPRTVTCTTSSYSRPLDLWIEEGKTYKALSCALKQNRWKYLIEINGHKMWWSKEYFYDKQRPLSI